MEAKDIFMDSPGRKKQLPTPRSPLSLSPGPSSFSATKPNQKRFKRLANRFGPKDDPFRQAQAESNPLVALSDDENDGFGTPVKKTTSRSRRRRLWDTTSKEEEQENDDELANLLDKWQAFVTPEKVKRGGGSNEQASVAVKELLVSSAKKRAEQHRESPASLLRGKSCQGLSSFERAVADSSSPTKKPRRVQEIPTQEASSPTEKPCSVQETPKQEPTSPERAVAETSPPNKKALNIEERPNLKRSRPTDGDDFDECSNWLARPQTKRTRLFATPKRMDRQEARVNESPSGTTDLCATNLSTDASLDLPKVKDLQEPKTHEKALCTPSSSSTSSPSSGASRCNVKLFSSPTSADEQGPSTPASSTKPSSPEASPPVALCVKRPIPINGEDKKDPSIPASSTELPSPEASPPNVLRAKLPEPVNTVQPSRKRGAPQDGLSPDRYELKRMKFEKLSAMMDRPLARPTPRAHSKRTVDLPRPNPVTGRSTTVKP